MVPSREKPHTKGVNMYGKQAVIITETKLVVTFLIVTVMLLFLLGYLQIVSSSENVLQEAILITNALRGNS